MFTHMHANLIMTFFVNHGQLVTVRIPVCDWCSFFMAICPS